MLSVDWHRLFVPEESLLELVIRGSVMFLLLFLVLRLLVKRHIGTLGVTDLLLVVLIADAAQNGMAGEYKTITGGIVLCGTVIFWSHALDWLAFRFPALERWIEPPPIEIIRNGRRLRRNLASELISEEELEGQLREHGIEKVAEVKRAYVESDGQISVIRYPTTAEGQEPHPRRRLGRH